MLKRVLPAKQQHFLELLKEEDIINDYYLAGGTAAALYLKHRQSEDFDFFTNKQILSDEILQTLRTLIPFNNIVISSQSKGSLHIFADDLKVSFLHYNYPLIKPLRKFKGIQLASLTDIALMKITAISGRGSKKDFIDLYYTCELKGKNLSKLFNLFHKKYKGSGYQTYPIIKSLTYFANAENEPDPIMLVPYNWDEIKKFFIKESKKLLEHILKNTFN